MRDNLKRSKRKVAHYIQRELPHGYQLVFSKDSAGQREWQDIIKMMKGKT